MNTSWKSLVEGILSRGCRASLSRAITLVESSAPQHQQAAANLLEHLSKSRRRGYVLIIRLYLSNFPVYSQCNGKKHYTNRDNGSARLFYIYSVRLNSNWFRCKGAGTKLWMGPSRNFVNRSKGKSSFIEKFGHSLINGQYTQQEDGNPSPLILQSRWVVIPHYRACERSDSLFSCGSSSGGVGNRPLVLSEWW